MPGIKETPEVHACGQCGEKFKTEDGYLNHTCAKSGVKPSNPKNLGEGFKKVQAAALARGAAKESSSLE